MLISTAPRLTRAMAGPVDEMTVLRRGCDMQGDDVGAPQKLIEGDRFGRRSDFVRCVVVRHHVHAEGGSVAGDQGADPTIANDSHALSSELRAPKSVAIPAAGERMGGGRRRAAHEGEQQAKAMFRGRRHVPNRLWAVAQADNPYRSKARRVEIDVIESGGGGEDVTQPWRLGDQRLADMAAEPHHHRVAIDEFAPEGVLKPVTCRTRI